VRDSSASRGRGWEMGLCRATRSASGFESLKAAIVSPMASLETVVGAALKKQREVACKRAGRSCGEFVVDG